MGDGDVPGAPTQDGCRVGPGWKPLAELADKARYLLMDGVWDEEAEELEAAPADEVVKVYYTSSNCDDFAVALHRITGWPIMALSAAERGPIHRFVAAPDGRSLDACGWTDKIAMSKRYGTRKPLWSEPGGEEIAHSTSIGDVYGGVDEHLADAVSAIRGLPVAPFSEPWFQAMSHRTMDAVDMPLAGYEEDGGALPSAEPP